jgi:ribosomal protein L32E
VVESKEGGDLETDESRKRGGSAKEHVVRVNECRQMRKGCRGWRRSRGSDHKARGEGKIV